MSLSDNTQRDTQENSNPWQRSHPTGTRTPALLHHRYTPTLSLQHQHHFWPAWWAPNGADVRPSSRGPRITACRSLPVRAVPMAGGKKGKKGKGKRMGPKGVDSDKVIEKVLQTPMSEGMERAFQRAMAKAMEVEG